MRTLHEIQQQQPASVEDGLPPEAVADSRQRFGSNQLTPLPREPLWKKFLDKFDEPIIKILLAAALLSMFVDLFRNNPAVAGIALGVVVVILGGLSVLRLGPWVPAVMFASAIALTVVGLAVPPNHPSVEGLAVMVAVILATGVAFLSEYKSDREFELLNAGKELQVKVRRDGEFHTLPMEELVVGDVVILEMGDEIPADGRLVKATDLYVDQSLMTGESEPAHKRARPDDTTEGPEQSGCLYRGTQVADGAGQMIITEVGDATYLGQIARRLSAEEDEDEEQQRAADAKHVRVRRKLTVSKELTPLQQKLEDLARLISKVGYGAAVAIFLALLVRGVIMGEIRWPASDASSYTIHDGSESVSALAFSLDGRQLATASWALDPAGHLIGEVKIREAATGYEESTLRGHTDLITAVAFSPDGRRLATAGRDDAIILWDLVRGKQVHRLADRPGKVAALAFSPDGKRLAAALGTTDGAGEVVVWDTDLGQELFRIVQSGGVLGVAFSPDGQTLASGGADRTVVRLWETADSEQIWELADLVGPVTGLAFSPDGQRLAWVSGEPPEARIAEASSGQVLQVLKGINSSQRCVLAFSADGSRLVVAAPGSEQVFDLTTGERVPARTSTGTHTAVALSSDGRQFATAGNRGVEVRYSGDAFWPVLLASATNLLHYLMYMVIIIVVAVPEGLPMSVTVSLALAMRKMTRANSLVRQLVACETIGSATVICSDKTGTLTQNKMQVDRLGGGEEDHDRGSDSWRAQMDRLRSAMGGEPLAVSNPLGWIVLNCAVNSTANLEEKAGQLFPVGNSTEGALLQWLHEAGYAYAELREQFPPLYQIHFSSERKRMTTVIRYSVGVRGQGSGVRDQPASSSLTPDPCPLTPGLLVLVKGAPEGLLEQSTHYQAADGSVRDWTPAAREAVRARLRAASAQAMRTLAFAHSCLPLSTPTEDDALHERRELLERDLVFAGFIAIRDPLRDDVKDAVAECRQAGIVVMMITGDNVETARAIGHEIGLVGSSDAAIDTPDAPILTSGRFNELSDDELKARMPRLRIVARARPLDKLRLVKLLQEQGEVVAVTGDGTNDAPALKKADVGLAMGRSGTEVAKEASKIVLLDDAFSTIVHAVHWGRSLYENIQRFVQFQLTINVSALVIAFLGPFFGVKPPFTILQLLWINVIMDTFAAIALCSEPPRRGLMNLPPKRRDESILTRSMLVTIFTTATFFVVVMMTLLLGMENGWWLGGPPSARSPEFPELSIWQVSLFFTVYVLFQVWNEINCRSLVPEVSGFRGLFRNPIFLTIVAATVVGQALIVTFGGAIFKVEPLRPVDWLAAAAGTASVLLFAEVTRRVRLALSD